MTTVNGEEPSAAGKGSAGRSGEESLHTYFWGKAKTCLAATGAFSCLLLLFPSPSGFSRCHPIAIGSVSNWVEAAFCVVESVFVQKSLLLFCPSQNEEPTFRTA